MAGVDAPRWTRLQSLAAVGAVSLAIVSAVITYVVQDAHLQYQAETTAKDEERLERKIEREDARLDADELALTKLQQKTEDWKP